LPRIKIIKDPASAGIVGGFTVTEADDGVTVTVSDEVELARVRAAVPDGVAALARGCASGVDRAVQATQNALRVIPEDLLRAARGVLVAVTADPDQALNDVSDAVRLVEAAVSGAAPIHVSVTDADTGGEARVILVAAAGGDASPAWGAAGWT
jgi:cell division GTPase FtsZ